MKYLARRLLHAIVLLIAISVCSFALVQWSPGDFFDAMRLNPRVSAQTVENLRLRYGLDESLPVRYAHWIASIAKGDMGYSFAYASPVAPLLWTRACNTLLLAGLATLLAWLLALPLGVWAAAKQGKWEDRACGLATSALITIPDLLVFLILLLIAVRTGWFPTGGMISADAAGLSSWEKIQDIGKHLILPAAGLAAVMLPVLIRHTRSAMIEALDSPFIRAARAHGIPRLRLLLRYALPAASNPLISLLGLSVGMLLSSSLIVEVVLSWPGLGPLMVQAILARDVYVVVGVVMLSSVFLIAGNLLADVLLFASDPRIRSESKP